MQAALLFPGQGSQELGMGRDLAEADSEIMELWKKAERISKLALREIYWEGDNVAMADTRHLQPGLTVTNLGLWRHLGKKIKPSAAAGHSLGELSAIAATGVLPEDTLLELVSLRGRLMAEADPEGKGSMAALLRLDRETAEACVSKVNTQTGKILVIANYNTPGQFVVAGEKVAITALQDIVKAAKGRMMPLAVSGAFHSPLMTEAAKEFSKAVDSVKKTAWNKPAFPIYCNASALPETEIERIQNCMKEQMTSPVRWIEIISKQWDNGIRSFIECGPKGVLSRMVEPILQEHPAASSALAANTSDKPTWQLTSIGNLEAIQKI